MQQMKNKKERGITLIALVVTIIVLIILAGISINLVFGNFGVITKAKEAKELQKQAQANEQVALNELDKKLEDYDKYLPENTKENPQDIGTIVKTPDKWNLETVKYIKTNDGLETKELTKVATVYAVSVGNGETVPVPKGFYYVGGNLSTGVIISDNEADKYDGKTDKTTYEYTTNLQGNQFVWIPCTSDGANGTVKYEKTSWGKQNAEWDTTTPKAEVQQIEKYGGFYVGRYEAGLASSISEFTTDQKHDGSNQIYNKDGVPQSKAGLSPWNFVDWTHSKANAESMYNNNYVSSGLITGTQWDVILNTLKSKASLSDSDMTNSSSWGNYKNTAIDYTGRKATAYYSSNYWYLPIFGSTEKSATTFYSDNYGDLLTTGASSTTEKYHIFDIAGNLWEWTEEDSNYATSGQYRVLRGGGLWDASRDYPACYRSGINPVNNTYFNVGFRVVLYIK